MIPLRSILARHITTSTLLRPIHATELDHICIVAKDIDTSILWYSHVLGMKHVHTNANHFYPTCKNSPAFLQHGQAKIAIAPLSSRDLSEFRKRRNFGEHFALTVSREEFKRAERDLPQLLKQHSPINHDINVEAYDYGHQLSLFFKDIDCNVVELTTWVNPSNSDRLSQV